MVNAVDENTADGANSLLDEVVDDIQAAIAIWRDAGNGTALNVSTEITVAEAPCVINGSDDTNHIWFGSESNLEAVICAGQNCVPNNVLGFMVPSLTISNSQLVFNGADIYFNSTLAVDFQTSEKIANQNNTSGFSFLGVLVHEMGHLFGLSHSFVIDDNSSDGVDTGASMFASVANQAQSIAIESLSRDDISAIKTNYASDSSFSGSPYAGRISGTVYRSNGEAQRGAQVSAISLVSNRTLAAAFTGNDGTKASPNGLYVIQGLPLNEPFIVVVEPLDRPDIVGSADPTRIYNVPISTALADEGEGFRDFAIEGYPDVRVVDLKLTRNISESPGVSQAQQFTLTAESPSLTGINFYLSNLFFPPNDITTANFTLAIEPDVVSDETPRISTADPLTISLSVPTDFSSFRDPSISLTATRNGINWDWSSALCEAEFRSSSMVFELGPPNDRPSTGIYELTVTVSDPKYGEFSTTRTINVAGWNDSTLDCVTYADGSIVNPTSSSSGGAGGCQLGTSTHSPALRCLLFFAVFGLVFAFRLARRSTCVATLDLP